MCKDYHFLHHHSQNWKQKNKRVFDNILHIHTGYKPLCSLSTRLLKKRIGRDNFRIYGRCTGSEVEVTRPSVTKKCRIVTLAKNFLGFTSCYTHLLGWRKWRLLPRPVESLPQVCSGWFDFSGYSYDKFKNPKQKNWVKQKALLY